MDKQKYIVSFSGGKDSTAMLHLLLNKNGPIDDVIFFDGGWEFPEMYDHIKLVEQKTGIKITVVKPPKPFEYYLNEIVLVSGKHAGKQGYGWPWAKGRWCTRLILTSNEFRIYYHRETCKITHVELIAYSERSEVHITYPEEKEPENWSIIKKAFQQILQGEKAQ